MEEDDDRSRQEPAAPAGPAMGPVYVMWENSLEKLKVLNYEMGYCGHGKGGRKPFNRIHFVYPGSNSGTQFQEFIDICSWLCSEIDRRPDFFHVEDEDDPNTMCNKLMLALRKLDFKSSFPTQKLRAGHGEIVCSVLDFLTDKALDSKGFKWGSPVYSDANEVEQPELDDDDEGDVEDEAGGGVDEEAFFEEGIGADVEASISLDNSAHQILEGLVDPIVWKTELERVGPKLKAQQQLSTNEWRAHVDQTVTSNQKIEKVLTETQADLQIMNKAVADELGRMRTKEKYMNNQYSALCKEYEEIKKVLEVHETKAGKINETVAKLNNELAEVSEKLEDIKETFESKDSGIHDTSPLVRIKAALQQIKQEACAFDLRIGVVSHSLLAARVGATQRRRAKVAMKAKQRKGKRTTDADENADDNSIQSGDDEE